MAHEKLKAAIRERMARTGEPYSVARRAVLNERAPAADEDAQATPRWFPLRYDANGLNGLTAFLDGVFSLGRPKSGVEVDRDEIRVRAPGFEQRIPRASIRTAHRWDGSLHGTSGVARDRGAITGQRRLQRDGRSDVRSALPHPSHAEHHVRAGDGSRGRGQSP
jgi:hypothetical protein